MKSLSLSEAMLKFISSVFVVGNRDIKTEIVNSGNMNFALINGADGILIALDNSLTFYFYALFCNNFRNMMSF